jgi:hypothetical protein
LTETKWGRCAILKDATADNDWLVLPWSFDTAVRVALAPGISAFSSGREYDHGGLSLQESVVPFMRVQRNFFRGDDGIDMREACGIPRGHSLHTRLRGDLRNER